MQPTNLYDIYLKLYYSLGLLMMDGETVRNLNSKKMCI